MRPQESLDMSKQKKPSAEAAVRDIRRGTQSVAVATSTVQIAMRRSRGNLLGREMTAHDVAQAFVDRARAESTSAAVITVDGGNIEAALR
jgi:hypothetical protein